MLPSDLLRTRTSRGRIYPLFCNPADDASDACILAARLLETFEDAQTQHMRKGDLSRVISEMEPDYDYKLVRGLHALLERRSEFAPYYGARTKNTDVLPDAVRRTIFSESSRVGLATSNAARNNIIKKTAALHKIPVSDVEKIMWADMDENRLLSRFDSMPAADLLLWYNMSLAQTLLFDCTRLEFCISEGSYWKEVLRAVKMQGLMYTLEYDAGASDQNGGGKDALCSDDHTANMRCILEGPLSLFKMTTRYGTSFARLLPIITRTPLWHVDATISKKTGSGTKLYRFEMSSASADGFLRTISSDGLPEDEPGYYDSSVEQKFADILHHHLGRDDDLGWRMAREPGPLISGNSAMIPDFVFERFGRRVYLEIVGFWTPDYIRRKVSKLRHILDAPATLDGRTAQDAPSKDAQKIDMLVGIDSSLLCSQFSEIAKLPGVFTFDKKMSVRPILDHLKAIDAQIERDAISNTRICLEDIGSDAVSIRDVALRYGIPEGAIPAILERLAPSTYVVAGSHVIPRAKISEVSGVVCGMSAFNDACRAMQNAGIPESCHADILSHAGYDVVWCDLNPANARIIKKT